MTRHHQLWLTPREVAAHLDCDIKTVKRTPPALLPFMRLTDRGDRRYRLEDVEAFIETRMVR